MSYIWKDIKKEIIEDWKANMNELGKYWCEENSDDKSAIVAAILVLADRTDRLGDYLSELYVRINN